MNIILPKLEPWQKDVADCLEDIKGTGRIFSVLSSRQCGKSILLGEALIHFAGNNAKTISIIVEPTFSQAKNIFSTIKDWLQQTKIVSKYNNADFSIELINGSKILAKSAAQRDSLRGYTCDFLCIDEACFLSEDIYPLILPWTNAKNAPILLVSTPLFPQGTFYNFWSNADNNVSFSFDWSNYDKSKFLTKEKLEYFRKQMPKTQFEAEFLGKWITNGAYVFNNVYDCVGIPEDDTIVLAGIDWGTGTGNDYTWVSLGNANGDLVKVEYYNDISPVKQIELISSMINSIPTLKYIQVELNSIGNVYYDSLKKLLNKKSILHGFYTSNDSKKEIIEDLATAFENHDIIIPNDTELINQLLHYAVEKTKVTYTYNGLKGFHDDACMATAMMYNCKKKLSSPYKNKIRI